MLARCFSTLCEREARSANDATRSLKPLQAGLRPTAVGPVAERWKLAAREGTPAEFARVVIPDVVDDTILYLLHAIDEGAIPLTFTASNGTAVNLTKEGGSELAGWYMGSDGCCGMYSKERFVDDFSDLR